MVKYRMETRTMQNYDLFSAPAVKQTTSKHLQIKRKTVIWPRRQLHVGVG